MSKRNRQRRSQSAGRRSAQAKRMQQKKRLQWAVVGGVFIAALLIGVQLASNRGGSVGAAGAEFYAGIPFTGTSIGDPNAPVKVVEYFDFQCPACQNASGSIVKPLIDQYVRSGDVHFTYRFFPILGPESVTAAEAAYCAAVQDSFWTFQDQVFARRATGNRGALSKNRLIKIATDLGMDRDRFAECLDSEQAVGYVQASYRHAVELGLPGTPVFLVNGQAVRTDPKTIEQAIEEALAGEADS